MGSGFSTRPPELGVWSLSPWTTREVPIRFLRQYKCLSPQKIQMVLDLEKEMVIYVVS